MSTFAPSPVCPLHFTGLAYLLLWFMPSRSGSPMFSKKIMLPFGKNPNKMCTWLKNNSNNWRAYNETPMLYSPFCTTQVITMLYQMVCAWLMSPFLWGQCWDPRAIHRTMSPVSRSWDDLSQSIHCSTFLLSGVHIIFKPWLADLLECFLLFSWSF